MLPSGNRNFKLAAKGSRAAQRRKLFELLNGIDNSGLSVNAALLLNRVFLSVVYVYFCGLFGCFRFEPSFARSALEGQTLFSPARSRALFAPRLAFGCHRNESLGQGLATRGELSGGRGQIWPELGYGIADVARLTNLLSEVR